MNKSSLIWFVSRVSLVIVAYIIIYYLIVGLRLNYFEGDSLNYHIPIAKSYLNLHVFNPNLINGVPFLKYSPGSSEGIIAMLMLFKIPINIFNVIGIFILLLVSYFAGRRFLLEKNLSIVFASSIVTLHTMIRWINTQIIDIWLLIFFLLSLALLQKPEKSIKYFALLGFSLGMLVGSKYTGPIFFVILFIFYIRKLWNYINLKRIVVFLIPFSIFGLSWYLRNYIYTGDPLYPQPFLFFKGEYFAILSNPVWKTTFLHSGNGIIRFFNALISEYGLFMVSIFVPFALFLKRVREVRLIRNVILIGSLCLFLFFFLPSDNLDNIVVSVFRYSYPAFVTLILSLFLIAQNYKKENIIAIFALCNILIIPELIFHPKLLFVLLPFALFIFYPNETMKLIKDKVLLKGRK